MSNPLDPAGTIIERFGGPAAVRQITGASRTRVYRWTRPKSEGGTGGLVPVEHAITLLRHAQKNAVPVTADDFLPLDLDPGEQQ